MVGAFCHMGQAWALGKTVEWPLFKLLYGYMEVTCDGKFYYRKFKYS